MMRIAIRINTMVLIARHLDEMVRVDWCGVLDDAINMGYPGANTIQ